MVQDSRDDDTTLGRSEFWKDAREASKIVLDFPPWKRGELITSSVGDPSLALRWYEILNDLGFSLRDMSKIYGTHDGVPGRALSVKMADALLCAECDDQLIDRLHGASIFCE